jgi:Domain of unknown function (DUF4270)
LIAILFSCEEDLYNLGFKGDDQRFKVYYAEIPIPSSVLLMDSVRSMNFSSRETNRLLVGSYVDPQMGEVRAKGFAQIRPGNITSFLPFDAVYDSVVFQARLDFYNYGTELTTPFELSIHEISDNLSSENIYFSKSEVSYLPEPLGSISTLIDPVYLDSLLPYAETDTVLLIKTKLSQSFGQRLFDAINPEDENFTNFNLFKKEFKGFAFVPTESNKLIGIRNISSTNTPSTLVLVYYHYTDDSGTTPTTRVGVRAFSLDLGVSFSNITSDRSGTELSGLTNYHEEFSSPLNRYVQSGVGIATKLDFNGFYDLIDDFDNVIINSAELAIDNLSEDSDLEFPVLGLVMLDENNRLRPANLTDEQDTTDFIALQNRVLIGPSITADALPGRYAASDGFSFLGLSYSKDDNKFVSYPTQFFQQLYKLEDESRYRYWALTAIDPTPTKSVNRAVFNKDNIKLRIYYTRPVVASQN